MDTYGKRNKQQVFIGAGSASGGMSIALQTLGDRYLELSRLAGISPELMHRVTSIATGGLDALPQNGAVITLLTICKLTHRQSYGDIFVVAAIVPVLALVAVIILGTLFGSFEFYFSDERPNFLSKALPI